MNIILKSTLASALILTSASCIREEPLNAECDILAVELPSDILSRSPVITNDHVSVILRDGVSATALAPEFEVTPGAVITPASGTTRDFTTPQEYTVTSQDGEWHKTYVVDVQYNGSVNLEYDFEHVRLVSDKRETYSYDVFYEVGADGQESLTWASANQAFALTLQGSTPDTFPTYQYKEGKSGACLALTTRSTGSFGVTVRKPLAAGSLFLGEFAMAQALSRPLEATHFGIPFLSVPVSLSGSYRYIPGETYCERDGSGNLVPVEGKSDMFNIYAVFFEVTPEMEWLDGTNVMAADNPNIIAVAEIADPAAADEWTDFTIPFVFREGKTVDPDRLKTGGYSITIVMSSSRDGDFFSGAVGSTLYVDELRLRCR